jgi:threonine/homoserine/homoserine lactone efflux protein
MPLRTLLLGTTLGLAPLCFLQAYLAEGLLAAFPWLIYPLLVTGIAYAVLFVWVLRRALRPEARRHRQDG